jgi:hypothetical protein
MYIITKPIASGTFVETRVEPIDKELQLRKNNQCLRQSAWPGKSTALENGRETKV